MITFSFSDFFGVCVCFNIFLGWEKRCFNKNYVVRRALKI